MDIKLHIGINELLELIKKLPIDEKQRIKEEVEKDLELQLSHKSMTELLLSGPVMTEEEEANFKFFNEEMDKWTQKLFV